MRPALVAKSGSRGNIQQRCCQGRMASSLSHRHTVLWLRVATMPQRWASRTMSAVLKRDSGRPSVDGNSQAMALTCTTTSGGKNRGAARSWSLFQACQALVKEAFAPKTNDVAAHRQRGGDFVIGATLRSQKDHSGTKHNIIWQRIFSHPTLQELPFLWGQTDHVWACSRHCCSSSLDETVADNL